MAQAQFFFGDIVVVDSGQIGIVVKSWGPSLLGKRGYHHEVYVRSYNGIKEYDEDKIQRYIVSKELSDEEREWHR